MIIEEGKEETEGIHSPKKLYNFNCRISLTLTTEGERTRVLYHETPSHQRHQGNINSHDHLNKKHPHNI